MSEDWENYVPAPIEVFHGEALIEFRRVACIAHPSFPRNEPHRPMINGIQFNDLIVEFKVKIMKQYGITSDAIPKEKQ